MSEPLRREAKLPASAVAGRPVGEGIDVAHRGGSKSVDSVQPYVLAFFRIVIGLLFACHGAAQLFGVFGGAPGGGATPVGTWPSWYAAVIQLAGGTLVLSGLFTRTAALIASGSMAYAYFVVHQSTALLPLQNDGEMSALYCWSFLLLAFTGPGTPAADQLLLPRRSPPTTELVRSSQGSYR